MNSRIGRHWRKWPAAQAKEFLQWMTRSYWRLESDAFQLNQRGTRMLGREQAIKWLCGTSCQWQDSHPFIFCTALPITKWNHLKNMERKKITLSSLWPPTLLAAFPAQVDHFEMEKRQDNLTLTSETPALRYLTIFTEQTENLPRYCEHFIFLPWVKGCGV